MIKVLKPGDRERVPHLFAQMFKDRAKIFHDKLRWAVDLQDGQEIDYLDREAQPIYLVDVDEREHVLGSLRILSSQGDILLKSPYGAQYELDVDAIASNVWECSRFYVKPDAIPGVRRRTSSHLLIGLCELSLSYGIEAIIGFFDRPMMRIYQKVGWLPSIIAQSRIHIDSVVGQWDVTPLAAETMRDRLKVMKSVAQDAETAVTSPLEIG